jgi:arginyl-tRNA synthetase
MMTGLRLLGIIGAASGLDYYYHPVDSVPGGKGSSAMAAPLIRAVILEKLYQAVVHALQDGVLHLETVPDIVVEHPANSEHGDFATSLPLQLARATRISPIKLAEALVHHIPLGEEVERVVVAPPGFINFHLSDRWLQQQVETVLQAGLEYAQLDVGWQRKVMVEFVSVNPNGPAHVGHARGAVLGSTLANILSAAGYKVTREYYLNDAGSQMRAFYRSVYIRYKQYLGLPDEMPANGYVGEYIVDLAKEIIDAEGRRFIDLDEESAVKAIGDLASSKMITSIRDDLKRIGVVFDSWFSEQSLYENGEYEEVLRLLRQNNLLSERDNALWFSSTLLGDDKDNVVIRSTGEPTYFAMDIAYHYNKFIQREFDHVIDIWGADHQGHIPRMRAAMVAMDLDPERLTIVISQMVTLKRGSEVIKASKRVGEFVTLRELVDEVGVDACRYFFLARTPSTQMEFDLELAKEKSSENPVYYIQYAHARNVGILNLARQRNINWSQGDVTMLNEPSELNLIRAMLRLPELVEHMAFTLEPHHLPHYAIELAASFHWFYENCRVVSDKSEDAQITLARLKLVESAQIVFRRALALMGMSAPDRM